MCIRDRYRLVLYALLLIVIMIVRPQGLLGTRELYQVFRKRKSAPRAEGT